MAVDAVLECLPFQDVVEGDRSRSGAFSFYRYHPRVARLPLRRISRGIVLARPELVEADAAPAAESIAPMKVRRFTSTP
jgi:hypothetical protein